MMPAASVLLLFHQPVRLGRAVVFTVVVVMASWTIAGHAFTVDGTVLKDDHAVASLELALVRANCGVPSSYSRAVRVVSVIRDRIELRHVPMRALIAERAGSVDEYCRQADQPFVNNENSLMLIETAVLRAWPGLSLSQLGQALHVIRLGGLAVFGKSVV